MEEVEKLIQAALGKGTEKFEFETAGTVRTGWRRYTKGENRPGNTRQAKRVESRWREFHENDIRLLVGPNVFKIGPKKFDHWVDVSDFEGEDEPLSISSNPSNELPLFEQILALPGLPVVDIIEFLKVGSHNDNPIPTSAAGQIFQVMMRQLRHSEPELFEPGNEQKLEMIRRRLAATSGRTPRWTQVQASVAEVFKIAAFEILGADEAGLNAVFVDAITKPQAKKIGKILLLIDSDTMELPVDELESLGLPVPMDRDGIPDYESAMTEYILATGRFKLWWD